MSTCSSGDTMSTMIRGSSTPKRYVPPMVFQPVGTLRVKACSAGSAKVAQLETTGDAALGCALWALETAASSSPGTHISFAIMAGASFDGGEGNTIVRRVRPRQRRAGQAVEKQLPSSAFDGGSSGIWRKELRNAPSPTVAR